MDRLMSMRVFQHVADSGSFSGAARDLDLSAAVVTRLVADLEDHLGVRLLQRTTRRVAVTEAGQAYLMRVRRILEDIDDAHATVNAHNEEMKGALRIQAPPLLAVHILAPLVSGFRALYPGVTFDIDVDSPYDVRIEEHDITLMGTSEGFDANVIARLIARSQGVLVASASYIARRGSPQQVADLATHDCLRLKAPGQRPQVWTLSQRHQPEVTEQVTVQPVMWANNLDVLLRATLDGAGISVMTLALAAPYLADGQLQLVLPQWVAGQFALYAALPSRRFLPNRTRVFLDYLTEQTRAKVSDVLKQFCDGASLAGEE